MSNESGSEMDVEAIEEPCILRPHLDDPSMMRFHDGGVGVHYAAGTACASVISCTFPCFHGPNAAATIHWLSNHSQQIGHFNRGWQGPRQEGCSFSIGNGSVRSRKDVPYMFTTNWSSVSSTNKYWFALLPCLPTIIVGPEGLVKFSIHYLRTVLSIQASTNVFGLRVAYRLCAKIEI